MGQDFEQYLTEKKNNNEYSSAVQSNFLNELFGFNKKNEKPCISVTIDFSNEKLINHIADSVKGAKDIKDEVKKTIVNYIAEINYAFKTTDGNLFARGLENGALRYYLKKYSKKTPEGNANDFISKIDTNLDMSFIKNSAIVKDDTYSDAEKENLENSLNALNPPKELVKSAKSENSSNVFKQALNDSKFINQLVEKISKPISTKLEKEKTIEDNGELKQVYCVPFKISKTLIKSNLDKSKTLNDFWYNITNDVGTKLLNILDNIDIMINSYIGFVPIKNYGFNIYFTDMDAADQFAEEFTEDDKPEIASRKRYANKIAKYPQLLSSKSEKVGDRELAGIEDPVKYFMNTLFAKEQIEPMIKEKFPGAEDPIIVRRYSVKAPKEIIDSILQNKQTDLKSCYTNYIKPIIEPFFKLEEFIGAGSEKDTFEFIFTSKASADSIKDQLINSLKINRNDINIDSWVLTKKELDAASNYIRDDNTAANNFKSFISEILNNDEHNKIELSALELILTDDRKNKFIKLKNDSNTEHFKGAVQTIIKEFEDKFVKPIDSCIGFIFDDDFKVTVYFKDDSGLNYAKEHYKSDASFKIGDSKKVTVSNTELNRIKDLHLSDGIYKSVDKAISDKESAEKNKKYRYAIKIVLDGDTTVGAFKSAYNSIPTALQDESFKSSLMLHLMNTVVNEAVSPFDNEQNDRMTLSDKVRNTDFTYAHYAKKALNTKISSLCRTIEDIYKPNNFKFEQASIDQRANTDVIGQIIFSERLKTLIITNLVDKINSIRPKIVEFNDVSEFN